MTKVVPVRSCPRRAKMTDDPWNWLVDKKVSERFFLFEEKTGKNEKAMLTTAESFLNYCRYLCLYNFLRTIFCPYVRERPSIHPSIPFCFSLSSTFKFINIWISSINCHLSFSFCFSFCHCCWCCSFPFLCWRQKWNKKFVVYHQRLPITIFVPRGLWLLSLMWRNREPRRLFFFFFSVPLFIIFNSTNKLFDIHSQSYLIKTINRMAAEGFREDTMPPSRYFQGQGVEGKTALITGSIFSEGFGTSILFYYTFGISGIICVIAFIQLMGEALQCQGRDL